MNDNPVHCSIYHHVVLLQKGAEFGVLALSRASSGVTVLGRSGRPSCSVVPQTEGFAAAKRNLDRSVAASVDAGWRVVWRGFPYGRPAGVCPRCASASPSGSAARFCGYCGGPLG